MKKMKNKILNLKKYKQSFLYFFLFLIFAALFSETSTITFKADKVAATVAENKKATNLIGNAEVKVDSLTISAERIEIFGKDYRYVNASGSIKGEDIEKGYRFKADLINFDRKTDTVTMFGNIELEDTKNDVKINTENMEYKKKQEIMIMRFNVKIVNKDITCTSMFALYNRKESKVELTGRPIVKKVKDEFKAGKISVDLDTEEISLDGRVRGSVEQKKEEKKEPKENAKTKDDKIQEKEPKDSKKDEKLKEDSTEKKPKEEQDSQESEEKKEQSNA